MTEKALLVRSATSRCGGFYGVGIDAPLVRVFDTSSGNICAEIDLRAITKSEEQNKAVRASILSDLSQHRDIHSKRATIASSRNVKLSSIHFVSTSGDSKSMLASPSDDDVTLSSAATLICVAGFSNGTICGVRILDNTLLYYSVISDTQQDVTSISSVTASTPYIFALCANHTLQVVNSATGERVISDIPVPSGTSTIAVASCFGESDNPNNTFEVLLSGIMCQVCSIHIPTHPVSRKKMSVVTTFAGSSTAIPTHSWLGGPIMSSNNKGEVDKIVRNRVAMTCAAAEGVIRLWDLHRFSSSSVSHTPHCCRIFSTSHRILSVTVQVYNIRQSAVAANSSTGDFGGVLCATTISGNVLLWRFERNLLPQSADPFSCPPLLRLSSTYWADGGGRLGKGRIPTMKILSASIPHISSSHDSVANSKKQMINVVRGKYALPHFEAVDVGSLIHKALRGDLFDDSCTFTTESRNIDDCITAFLKAPVSYGPDHLTIITTEALESCSGTDSNALLAMKRRAEKTIDDWTHDDVDDDDIESKFILESNAGWASHQADAHRAMNIASEEFQTPTIYHASSVKHLPNITPAENMVEYIRDTQGLNDTEFAEASDVFPTNTGNTLGLAVIPLYQALHVNDKSAVMELITLASRDAGDMAATIKRLKIQYLLQLFQILSERLITLQQISHPFHLWIKMILSLRGMEMCHYETRQRMIREKGKDNLKGEQTESSMMSLPSVFTAPLLNSYINMVVTRDRLAACWGRLSTIAAVRPRQTENRRTNATVSHGTIGADSSIFPYNFKDIVVAAPDLSINKLKNKNKLLKGTNCSVSNGTLLKIVPCKGGISKRDTNASRRDALREARRQRGKRNGVDSNLESLDADMLDSMMDDENNNDDVLMAHMENNMVLDEDGDCASVVDDVSVVLDEDEDDEGIGEGDLSSSDENASNLLDSEEELGLEENKDESSDGENEEETDDEVSVGSGADGGIDLAEIDSSHDENGYESSGEDDI